MEKILSRNSWSEQTECNNCHGKTTWTEAIITLDTRHHESAYCELFDEFEHLCPKCAVTLRIHEKRTTNITSISTPKLPRRHKNHKYYRKYMV